VSCHMPAKLYMVVDARRDHRFPIPRPDLSGTLGTPNACTGCHTDRSPAWAAAEIERRRGSRPSRAPSFAAAIAAGRAGGRDAAPRLVALITDPRQPAIVRATALDLLHDGGAASVAAMVSATRDDDPVVRMAAVSSLARLPINGRIGPVTPLLRDPIRAVRIEAARALAAVPRERLDASGRRARDAALAELVAAQRAMADMPSAHVTLGDVQQSLGRHDLAERSYRTALRMDPGLFPARIDLASLHDATGRAPDSERVLRDGLARDPGNGELHYALGLLLAASAGRRAEAAGELAEAARLMPGRARVHYNHGLTLQHLGQRRAAEAELLRAHELDRGDPGIVYALAIFYLQQQSESQAVLYGQRLAALARGDAGTGELLQRLRQAMIGERARP
jgi:Flp pilus assembly protein TadD